MKAGFVTSKIRSHLKKFQCYELEFSGISPAFIKHNLVYQDKNRPFNSGVGIMQESRFPNQL
jgi:hypothetical protein